MGGALHGECTQFVGTELYTEQGLNVLNGGYDLDSLICFAWSVFCIFLRLHSDVQNLKGNIYIKSSQLKNRTILTALLVHLRTRIKTPLSSVFQKLVGFTTGDQSVL